MTDKLKRMSEKDRTIRTCMIFALACHRGAKPTAEQFRKLATLCAVTLPSDLKLTRTQFAAISSETIKRLTCISEDRFREPEWEYFWKQPNE